MIPSGFGNADKQLVWEYTEAVMFGKQLSLFWLIFCFNLFVSSKNELTLVVSMMMSDSFWSSLLLQISQSCNNSISNLQCMYYLQHVSIYRAPFITVTNDISHLVAPRKLLGGISGAVVIHPPRNLAKSPLPLGHVQTGIHLRFGFKRAQLLIQDIMSIKYWLSQFCVNKKDIWKYHRNFYSIRDAHYHKAPYFENICSTLEPEIICNIDAS